MKILVALLLTCAPCLAQFPYSATEWSKASGGTCDFICSTAPTYIWTNNSLASGQITTDWVDGISSMHFTAESTTAGVGPTNNLSANGGVWFLGGSALSAMTNGAGISMSGSGNWTIATMGTSHWVTEGALVGNAAGNSGFYLASGELNIFYSGGPHGPGVGSLAADTRYAIMVSSTAGTWTCWTNGVLYSSGFGFPTWTLTNIGNDTGDDPYQGYQQKIVVWPTKALAISDAVNWTTYCNAHNP